MALTAKSLILYGFEVTQFNSGLSWQSSTGTYNKQIPFGYYSFQGLMEAIVGVMNSTDPSSVYTYAIDRTMSGGTQNRVTLNSSSALFTLYFANPSTIGGLIGYLPLTLTGSTSYQSQNSAGSVLIPEYIGYSYVSPEMERKVQGAINISANGEKEAVVFANQQFVSVNYKYEPQAKVITQWAPFLSWAVQQRPFEFTPQVTEPNTVYDVTLEKTASDGKGLGYKMLEQLPDFPFSYQTGLMTMRRRVTTQFII